MADQLEHRFGYCPSSRHDFLSWVDDQLERCARLGLPGEEALRLIETGYVQWRADLLGSIWTGKTPQRWDVNFQSVNNTPTKNGSRWTMHNAIDLDTPAALERLLAVAQRERAYGETF